MDPRGEKVLLVEDDPDIRELLGELLRLEGYDVVTAADGFDAITLLREGLLPDVILLDLMMPRVGGMEFRVMQLDDARLRDIPVVVFTADSDIQQKARAMGISAAIKKPIELAELKSVLEGVMRG